MAKPKMYGLNNRYNPRLQLDVRYQRKQKQRQRENATRKPVAGQIRKTEEE